MRRAARRDASHGRLARRFIALGCSFLTLPAVEPGTPDALVGCARRNHLVELKTDGTRYGKQGASPVQREWAARWRGEPVELAATEADVDALVARWRAQGTP